MRPTHVSQTAITRRPACQTVLLLEAAIGATPAFANVDPLTELLTVPGSAPLGWRCAPNSRCM